MLHPNRFEVNEAWIAFQLNDAPIETAQDGSFNAVCLMDAASCFILETAMVPAESPEPSQLDARRIFKSAWSHKKQFATTLFVPTGQFQTILPAEAKRHGMSVLHVEESQLMVFIGEARQGFREHVQGIGNQ